MSFKCTCALMLLVYPLHIHKDGSFFIFMKGDTPGPYFFLLSKNNCMEEILVLAYLPCYAVLMKLLLIKKYIGFIKDVLEMIKIIVHL